MSSIAITRVVGGACLGNTSRMNEHMSVDHIMEMIT